MNETQPNRLSNFIKASRNRAGLTQEALAIKAGVGLRFIRDLEQGKTSLRMDKANQVLALFGHSLAPGSDKIVDPFEIMLRYMDRPVKIVLKNKQEMYGNILGPHSRFPENIGWKFLSNNNMPEYKKTSDDKLLEYIGNWEIATIENRQL